MSSIDQFGKAAGAAASTAASIAKKKVEGAVDSAVSRQAAMQAMGIDKRMRTVFSNRRVDGARRFCSAAHRRAVIQRQRHKHCRWLQPCRATTVARTTGS